MKRRTIFIIIILMGISFITGTLLTNNVYRNYYNKLIIESNKTNTISNSSSSIAMMLETDLDSNEYYLSTDTSWPDSSSYSFNSSLSKCENGSTLSWDSDNNQVLMTGSSSDKCYIYFDIESTLVNYVLSKYSIDGVNNLYYFDGEGDYDNAELELNDLSYRYSGADYVLTSKATDAGYVTVKDTSADIDTGVINLYCSTGEDYSYIGGCDIELSTNYTGYYYLNYDTEQTQYDTYYEALKQAVDDGYLEANIGNYVCFGSDDCTNVENLYRIIGLFLNKDGYYEAKLIKYDYATSDLLGTDGDYCGLINSTYAYYLGNLNSLEVEGYYWNYTNSSTSYSSNGGYYNDWSYSGLNITNLNKNFLKNIGNWANLIVTHTWIVGGNTEQNLSYTTASNSYINEITNPVTSQVESLYDAKIGLMYINDYTFAMDPIFWNIDEISTYHSYDAEAYDWMYMGIYEWTITRVSSTSDYTFTVDFLGYIYHYAGLVYEDYIPVRPTFYLSSSVLVSGGDGTYDNPYILSVN